MFLTTLRHRCSQLETALRAKAPINENYLVYVTLNIEVSAPRIEYRLAACLWKSGSRTDEAAFVAHLTSGSDPNILLDKLSRDISVFELWTPAAIAATLGIEESV